MTPDQDKINNPEINTELNPITSLEFSIEFKLPLSHQ